MIVPSGGRTVAADLVVPPEGADALVVLVHGGGWTRGSRTDYAGWAAVLAAAGFATLSVDYTLATGEAAAWPAAAQDVAAAFDYARSAGHGPVGALATSAGAHLAATAALTHDTGLRAAVLVNGVYDLVAGHAHSAGPVEALMGTPPAAAPFAYSAASPVVLAGSSPHATTCAWTLVYGDHDPVVPPLDQSQPFAAALQRAGADVVTFAVPADTHHWNTGSPVDEGPNLAIRDLVLSRLAHLRSVST